MSELFKSSVGIENDTCSDGGKFSFETLIENLRKYCKPTTEMMLRDIESLNRKVEILRSNGRHLHNEIEKREKKLKICQDGKEANARLDTLFPGEIIWQ